MRRLPLFLVVAGCARAVASTTPRPPEAVPVPVAVVPAPAVVAPPESCAVPMEVDTIDDGDGAPTPTGSMDLGDVQVIANDEKIALAWTRQSNFLYGDSWRSPWFALKSAGAWHKVEMPTMAFACALYGASAANTIEHPFVSWGVRNNNVFEVFDELPSERTKPSGSVMTAKQTIDHVVASRNVSLAVLSEDLCEPSCTCADGHRRMAVWLRSLDRIKPWAQRLSQIYEREDNLGAPAIAMGESGGIVAYRVKSTLHLAWLDAEGKPLTRGTPVAFDAGDVGAPAVAMAGTDAIVVWAHRAAKDEPYELQSMRLGYGAAPIPPTPIKTSGSAFAPAVLADAKAVVVAWMEGDAGRHGEIRIARGLGGPSIVVSGEETNARDPELSGTPEHPVLVWQSFSEHRRAGVIRAARVDCAVYAPRPQFFPP